MTGTARGIPGFIGHMISHVTDKSISELVNVSDNVEMSVSSFALNFSPHDKRLKTNWNIKVIKFNGRITKKELTWSN